MNPLAFKRHLMIQTSTSVAIPIGYLTSCGLPVFYGLVWRMAHLDFQLEPREPMTAREKQLHPII